MSDVIYTPEMDCGELLDGQPCMSANAWIPEHKVPNKQAILAAATFTSVDREGNVTVHQLAHEVNGYLVVARHLFEDWERHIPDWLVPDIEYEEMDWSCKFPPRDEKQQEAWNAFEAADSGILNLACGGGKTFLALKKVASLKKPALIIVNLTGLMSQWKESAMFFLGLEEDQIGYVWQNKRQWDRPFVIAMINTLGNIAPELPEEVKQRFGVVIWDEVHHLAAPTFLRTAGVFYGQRFGLSATPDREDGLDPVYKAHVGEIFHSNLEGDLVADTTFKQIDSVQLDLQDEETAQQVLDTRGEVHTQLLLGYMSRNESRNKLILRDVKKYLKEGRKVLCLTGVQKHPEELKNMLASHPGMEKYKIGAVSGKTKKDRVDIIRGSDVTFATLNTAAEALDAPALDTVLFITPFKAWRYYQQGKGRAERAYEGKKDPIAIIYEDKGVPHAMGMCRSLKRQIRERGLTYSEQKRKARSKYRKV